jgi:hypothetical protein
MDPDVRKNTKKMITSFDGQEVLEYIRKHFGLEATYNQGRSFHASDPPREDFFALTRFVVYELILFVSHFARLQRKTPFRFDVNLPFHQFHLLTAPPHLEIVQNISALLLALRLSPSSFLPQATPLQQVRM